MFVTCPVCNSKFGLFVKSVYGQRSGNVFPLYYCMDCASFWNFSEYKEGNKALSDDFEFLIQWQDHIVKLQGELISQIMYRAPGISNVCEVGFGTGLFLSQCKNFGLEEYGFEINQFCYEYAKNTIGINCELGTLGPSHTSKYDLMAAIGVFEHLENPRSVFHEMVCHLNRDGYIYINVPFINRNQYRYLREETLGLSNPKYPNPFFDNDVHIVHFSIEGLKNMGLSYGAKQADFFISKDIVDNSPGAYPGILFSF